MNGDGNEDKGRLQIADYHVREVVRSAEEELRQLLRQRAEVMKRIGAIKRTLAGLAKIFGDSVLDDELLVLLDRKPVARRSGFTRACRLVVMDSATPLAARQVCETLQQRFPDLLERHKNPLASVTTVLTRLVDYAEVRTFVPADGHRVWVWIADEKSSRPASDFLSKVDEPTVPQGAGNLIDPVRNSLF